VKIGYFGDGPWAHNALNLLLRDPQLTVAFVCARFDSTDQVLGSMTNSAQIDFISHGNINSEEFLSTITRYNCDILVSMSFNQIFKREILSLPPQGIVNCHAGKLPFYRGRNILNWVLINDESEFGITVHYVDEGIDTGDIILQRPYPISDLDDYSSLLERAYEGCGTLLHQALQDIRQGKAHRTPQSTVHPTGFYCTSRVQGDEILDWNQTSREVFNFVRSLCAPGPQATTFLSGCELKINRVAMVSEAPAYKGVPGAVLGVHGNSYLVKTRDTFIRVLELAGDSRPRVGDRLS